MKILSNQTGDKVCVHATPGIPSEVSNTEDRCMIKAKTITQEWKKKKEKITVVKDICREEGEKQVN